MKMLVTVSTTSISAPHPFQIAATVIKGRACLQSASLLIRPDGWEIPERIGEDAGIAPRDAQTMGIPLATALRLIKAMTESCTDWFAYNEPFVSAALSQGMADAGQTTDWRARTMRGHCVMRACGPLCKLQDEDGRDKWPTLAEACSHFQRDNPSSDLRSRHAALIELVHALEPMKVFL